MALVVLVLTSLGVRTTYATPSIVINEFELNPPGDDYAPGAEFVELYNSGLTSVSIGGWKVATTHGVPIVVIIPSGAGIPARGFYIVTHTTQWLDNTDERIILRDAVGVEIDTTPVKSDEFNDARSWQRFPDGAVAWYFDMATKSIVNVPEFQNPVALMTVALLGAFIVMRLRTRRRFKANLTVLT